MMPARVPGSPNSPDNHTTGDHDTVQKQVNGHHSPLPLHTLVTLARLPELLN